MSNPIHAVPRSDHASNSVVLFQSQALMLLKTGDGEAWSGVITERNWSKECANETFVNMFIRV